MTSRQRRLFAVIVSVVALLLIALGGIASQLPSAGAGGLLHPTRRRVDRPPPPTCEDATFTGEGLGLKGWRCRAAANTVAP